MAKKENEYTEEVAAKKQQTKVPDPTKGEGNNGDGSGGVKIQLTSGAVPPVKTEVKATNAAPAPVGQTQIAPVEPRPLLDDLKVKPRLAKANPPVLNLHEVGHSSEDWKDPNFVPPEGGENMATTVRPLGNEGKPPTEGTSTKDKTKDDTNVDTTTATTTTTGTGGTTNTTNTNVNTTETTETTPQPLFKTDPKVGEEFANEIKSWGLNGNVDYLNRPMVEGAEPMVLAGGEDPNGAYKMPDGKSYAHNVILTPVRKDGTVWSQEQLKGYWDTLVQTCADLEKEGIYVSPLELDKDGEALIVGMDTPADITSKLNQAYNKYYAPSKPQVPTQNTNVVNNANNQQAKTGEGNGTVKEEDKAENIQNSVTAKTDVNASNSGDSGNGEKNQQTNVKNEATSKSVEDWKKDYADNTKEELEWKLNARKGVPGIDPNDIKALEELIAEKGGGETPEETGTATTTEAKATTPKVELSEEEKAAKAEAKQRLHTQYSAGSNKDLLDLPIASEAKMVEAGWIGASGKGNQMLYPVIVNITDSKGKKHKVLMSPIMSNGAVMTQEDFKAYVDNLDEMDDIMGVDKAGCGLIIKMDATDVDLNALDALEADIIKGESPSLMTLDEEEKADSERDPVSDNYDAEIAKTQEALKAAEELLANPMKSPKGAFIEENNKQKEEFDKETEEIKKKNKRSRLIAGIGDLLQILLNSTGAFLGAKSADLTSLSGAAAKSHKEELTLREKRREDLVKNMDNENIKLIRNLQKDVDYWRKHLDDLNKEASKYKADTAKAFRNAKIKAEQEKQKTVEQGKRRVAESKTRTLEAREKSRLKKDEIAFKGEVQTKVNAANNAGKAAVKATPSHSIVEHRGSGGSGGSGSSGGKGKNKPSSGWGKGK